MLLKWFVVLTDYQKTTPLYIPEDSSVQYMLEHSQHIFEVFEVLWKESEEDR
jgi:hypothetical protein